MSSHIQTVVVSDKKALMQALASNLKKGASLFTRHIICPPDLKWKKHITNDILSSGQIPILTGVEFELLPKLIFSLCGKARSQPVRIPPKDILALHLLPLLEEEKDLDVPRERAVRQLRLKMISYQLAEQMIMLGKFGGDGLDSFLNEETLSSRLFKKVFSFWDHPYKCLKRGLSGGVKQPFYLHVIGHSFIPQVYQKLMQTMGPQVHIIYYQFAYCHAFWTDILSDSGALSVQSAALEEGAAIAPIKELQCYLMDRNPLLANLGQLHLSTKKQFETYQEYKLQEQIFLAMTNLDALKQDVMSNTNGTSCKKSDDSLAIFKCKSRRDEVLVLREKVERLLLSSAIGLQDITIYAPEMALYSPLIQEVFAKEPALPVIFFDEKQLVKSPLFQAIRALLRTFSKPVTYKSFFNFFSLPAAMNAFGISEEESVLFARLLEEANFAQGLGPASFDESAKTFAAAVQRLMLSSLFVSEDRPLFQNTFLGKSALSSLVHFAHRVMEFSTKVATFFTEEHTPLSFYEGFMDVIEVFGPLDEQGAEGSHLKAVLDLLKTLDEPLGGAKLKTQDLVEYILKSFEQTSTLSVSGNLNAIVARNISITTYYPNKAAFVLGVDQDSFPRKVTAPAKPYLEDLMPSVASEDRAVFLSLLLQTEQMVHISFASYCEKENAELLSSPFIEMVRDYLGPLGMQEYIAKKAPLLIPAHSAALLDFTCPSCTLAGIYNHTLPLTLEKLRGFSSHPVRFFFQEQGVRLPFKNRDSYERLSLSVKKKQHEQNSAQQWQNSLEEAHLAGFFPGGLYGDLSDEEVKGQRALFLEGLKEMEVKPSQLFSLKLEAKNNAFSIDEGHVVHAPSSCIYLDEGTLQLTITGFFPHLCSKGLIIHADFNLENVVKYMADLATFFSLEKSTYFEKKVWFLGPSKLHSVQMEKEDFKPFFHWFLEQRGSWFPLLPGFASLFKKRDAYGLKKAFEQILLNRSDAYLTHGLTAINSAQIDQLIQRGHHIMETVFNKVAPHA